jgi:hypothetical protein
VSLWCESTTGRYVKNKKYTAHNSKNQDSAGQNVLGWIPLDQRSYQDRADALESLVETCQYTNSLKCDRDIRSLLKCIVTICRKSDDGAIESLESEFVHHDTSDVHSDVSSLDGRVNVPCFADDRDRSELGHVGGVLRTVATIPGMRRRSLYNPMEVILC